jgi:hypothetical protein
MGKTSWQAEPSMLTLVNGRFGEKSDDFGSRTEQSPATRVNFSFKSLIRGDMPNFAGDEMERMAALREEWFAQIADAIEGAQRVAWQLGAHECTSFEAGQLYGRLETARKELESLRGVTVAGRFAPLAPPRDPDWLQRLGWDPRTTDPA